MKVIINTCFGGFSISALCLWDLIKQKDKGVSISKWKEDNVCNPDRFQNHILNAYGENIALPKGWYVNFLIGSFIKLTGKSHDLIGQRNTSLTGKYHCWKGERTSPALIKLIETKGADWCGGPYTKFKIVKIPDGIEYEISDYYGMEAVHEKHRVWE